MTTTNPTATATSGPRYTPAELSVLLGLRHRPTPEQAAIIAAPVEPLLVVAGAGSGKTETMAARVVWLVANGYVRADQVLGLTFTRKAAGELGRRVRARLASLVRRLGPDELIAGEPTVATYHSYAARIVTEHGMRAGYEPTVRLLTEAACWQLADSIVREYDGDMSAVDAAPETVVDAVLRLAEDLAEHLVDPDDLAAFTGRFHAEVLARCDQRPRRAVADLLSRQRARLALLPLVREYAARKRAHEAMDFGDQMSRAARVARDHPVVGAAERDRYRVVLLDEFQDTSHAQVTLLRALYGGGHPVTAVGDPYQSIYGWRGASAGALDRFPTEFPSRSGRGAAALSLSTSWRNRPEILTVANTVSRPLRGGAGRPVARLVAPPVPDPPLGAATVRCALLNTRVDEANWVAGAVLAAWRNAARTAGVPGADHVQPVEIPPGARPTTAVLVRGRAQIATLEAALRARGLPVEVVGLGGLLDTPEVRDVVSTLRVLADPTAGAALMRLLTGPRWRIGPRDLVALYRRAREMVPARPAGPAGSPAHRLDQASLIDALDDPGDPDGYSVEGYRRLRAFAAELDGLRRRLDQSLPELLTDIEQTMGLDVEVAVAGGDAGAARAHLDAIGEVAARFAAEADGATLTSFLAYLDAAESEERGLRPGEVDVVEGAVQILTMHAAKGLEWDVVAVAGLTERVFPTAPRRGDHWLLGLGVLPFPLRGDRAGLPALDLAAATDAAGVAAAVAAFEQDWQAYREREERRLAYVAVTRPRRLLLCSGYWWGEGTARPRGPSPFLVEIRAACEAGGGAVDVWAPPPVPGEQNPTAAVVPRATWPADPLGERRPVLAAAAALVRDAVADAVAGPVADSVADSVGGAVAVAVAGAAGAATVVAGAGPGPDDGELARWAYEVDLLLAERERSGRERTAVRPVPLPDQLSVSQLVALRRDPAAFAARVRRPMPERPDPLARRGSTFHQWLERRFGAQRLFDLDEMPGAADADAAPDADLDALRRRFLASQWADRVPVAVEVPFATEVAGVLLRGRIDAVYADADGGYDVIDWKTGRQPSGVAAQVAAVQLSAYRLAWADITGVAVQRVRAGFHYVGAGQTVRPVDLLDAQALIDLVRGLPLAPDDGAG